MMKIATIFLICIALCSKAQSPKEVIQRYLDTVSLGAIEEWTNMKSAYIERLVFFSDPNAAAKIGHKAMTSLHKSYRVWPDKSLSEVYEDSVLSMKTLHVRDKHFLIYKNGFKVEYSTEPYEPYFEFDPVLIQSLLKKAKSVTFEGEKIIDGIRCLDIQIKTRQLKWHFYFNMDSYLLEYWYNTPDESVPSLTKVYDYKPIGNFLIPMSEHKINNGNIFYSGNIIKLELDKEIAPEKFKYN
jgi:hypothetical protein